MRQPALVGVRQPLSALIHIAERLLVRELLADLEEVAKVPALDELHHDEVLAGFGVLVDRKHRDDVRVADRHPELAFAQKQVDLLLVHGPLVAEDLDRHDLPGPRVVPAEYPAEAPGRDFVEDAEAAKEVAVEVALAQLLPLPRRKVPLALQGPDHVLGRTLFVFQFIETLAHLLLGNQSELDRELPDSGSVEVD